MMSPEECATLDGVFQGDGSDCATAACPEPIGACCLPGGCLEMAEVDCDVASGTWTGSEQTCDACLSCPADLSGDGGVGFNDLTALLAGWGPCGDCPEDLSGDGSVGFDDLTTLLAGWGPC
jgi:hypothetical protein